MREGQAVQHGQITLGKEQRARLLAAGIRFFLTAALCAARCPGGYAPFALGCVSAAGPGVGGAAAPRWRARDLGRWYSWTLPRDCRSWPLPR